MKRPTSTISTLITVLLCFFISNVVCQPIEQEEDYTLSRYSDENGLARNHIHYAHADREGFLWIITDYSLQRFDGKKFFNVTYNGEIRFAAWGCHADMLPDYGLSLMDADSTIWQHFSNTFISTHTKFKPSKKSYLYNGSIALNKTNYTINSTNFFLPGMRDGWIINKDTFVLHLKQGIGIFTSRELINYIPVGEETTFKYNVLNRRLLIQKGDSLRVYDTRGVLRSTKKVPGFSNKRLSLILDVNNSNFYLHGDSTFIKCVLDANDSIRLIPFFKAKVGSPVYAFWQRDNNTIVVITYSKGIYVFKKKPFKPFVIDKSIHPNDFYTQYVLNNRFIGVENLILKDDSLQQHKAAKLKVSGRFVVASGDGKTYLYSTGDKISGPLLQGRYPGDPQSTVLSTTPVTKAFFDNSQKIWVFTMDGKVGYIHNDSFYAKSSLPSSAYHILDLDSCLLISNYSGLYSLNKTNFSLKAYPEFAKHQVRYCVKEKDGIIWVFTYGNGVFALVNNKKVTINLDAQKKLLLSHYMFKDSLDRVWIATNSGLFVTLYSELAKNAYDSTYRPFYYRFEKNAGFITNEFNGGGAPPYVRLPDGTVSMSAMQGLVVFNPNKTKLPFTKGIALDKVLYNNTPVANLSNIIIPNTAQNITFLISAIDYQISPNALVDFQLVEADEEPLPNAWQPLSSDGKITLSSIRPDQYHLIIRQRIGLGANDFFYKNIEFSIPLHWYQTTLFFIALGVLLIVTFFIVFRIRTRMLQKKNQKLEATVQAAVSNLEQTLNALQDSNAQKDKLFSIIAHDLKSPINNLISVLQHTENNLLSTEDVTVTLKEVKKDATVIQKTLDNLLNWSLLQMGIKHFRKEKIKMLSFLTTHTKLYNKLAKEKNIDIRIECNKSIVIEADRNQLSLIIRNFIDNAIKFTPPNGTITAGVQQKFFTYKIFVSNTGPAISAAAINKILYSGEMNSTPGTAKEKGTGLGLQLCKEFITNLNSRLEIYISEDQQTVFAFEISLESQVTTA